MPADTNLNISIKFFYELIETIVIYCFQKNDGERMTSNLWMLFPIPPIPASAT